MKGTKPWAYVLIDRHGQNAIGSDQESIELLRTPFSGVTIIINLEHLVVRQMAEGHWQYQIFIHESLIEGDE